MKRLLAATRNSIAALRKGFASEAAIRQELIVILLSVPVAFWLTNDPWRLLLLWSSLLLILAAELLNTGIEQLADRITTDHDEMIGFAKDCGSAAVMAMLIIAGGVWFLTILEKFELL